MNQNPMIVFGQIVHYVDHVINLLQNTKFDIQ